MFTAKYAKNAKNSKSMLQMDENRWIAVRDKVRRQQTVLSAANFLFAFCATFAVNFVLGPRH
jgi:hypothetical protein